MEWQSCERCKHELKDGKKGSPCFDCGIEAKGYEPKTNADRIRYMTDEELLNFLCGIDTYRIDDGIYMWIDGYRMESTRENISIWLQAEVKEGESNA